jgi:hypothetical protein
MAVMLAVDLLAATQNLLLHDDLARAEPKTPRYRLLHNSPRPRTTPPLAAHPTHLALGS